MRPLTFWHYLLPDTVEAQRIDRGGLCRSILINVNGFTLPGAEMVGYLRGKATTWIPAGKAEGDQDNDILAWATGGTNGGGSVFLQNVDVRIPDGMTLYLGTNVIYQGATSEVFVIVTLWFDDTPERLPEEDLPETRGRMRARGRSFNLEAARGLISDPDVELQRRKKPAH